jgi:hypothetical protein
MTTETQERLTPGSSIRSELQMPCTVRVRGERHPEFAAPPPRPVSNFCVSVFLWLSLLRFYGFVGE